MSVQLLARFNENPSVVCYQLKWIFIENSSTFKSAIKWSNNDRIELTIPFEQTIFDTLIDSIDNEKKIPCDIQLLINISNLCAYLGLEGQYLLSYWPRLHSSSHDTHQTYTKLIFQLLKLQYQDIARVVVGHVRLPDIILSLGHLKYQQFKKRIRNMSRLCRWYCVHVLPSCTCFKCTNYRHERLIQLMDCTYPTPYFGPYHSGVFK